MKPDITSKKIRSTLSNRWLNFKEIVDIIGIEELLDRKYLQLKINTLCKKGELEYEYRLNNKYWKTTGTEDPIEAKQNLKKPKLGFCSECGALMLPAKENDLRILKCKCGVTKPFDEKQTQMYVLKTKIPQPFEEEAIYLCVCGKKFESQVRFLKHSKACQECKQNIIPGRWKPKRVFYEEPSKTYQKRKRNIIPKKRKPKRVFSEEYKAPIVDLEIIERIKDFLLKRLNIKDTQIEKHRNHDIMIRCHVVKVKIDVKIVISFDCLDCKEFWKHSIYGIKDRLIGLYGSIDYFFSLQNEVTRYDLGRYKILHKKHGSNILYLK